MATDKIYPKGLRTFPAHEKAPAFVLGTLVVTPRELIDWITENPQYLKDYNDQKQLKLKILNGNKGIYFEVDTYEKGQTQPQNNSAGTVGGKDDLPF